MESSTKKIPPAKKFALHILGLICISSSLGLVFVSFIGVGEDFRDSTALVSQILGDISEIPFFPNTTELTTSLDRLSDGDLNLYEFYLFCSEGREVLIPIEPITTPVGETFLLIYGIENAVVKIAHTIQDLIVQLEFIQNMLVVIFTCMCVSALLFLVGQHKLGAVFTFLTTVTTFLINYNISLGGTAIPPEIFNSTAVNYIIFIVGIVTPFIIFSLSKNKPTD